MGAKERCISSEQVQPSTTEGVSYMGTVSLLKGMYENG